MEAPFICKCWLYSPSPCPWLQADICLSVGPGCPYEGRLYLVSQLSAEIAFFSCPLCLGFHVELP